MWIFNSLRRRVPDGLAMVALPVGIAIAGHAVVIGTSTVLATRTTVESGPPPVIDNSRELVRLSRRVAQTQPLASVGLSLSGTLPPPPAPDLLDVPSGEKQVQNCDPRTKADQEDRTNPSVATGASASQSTMAFLPPLEVQQVSSLWEEGDPVESWPDEFGAFPEDSQVREVPLDSFRPRTTLQLNALVISSPDAEFLLRARDEAVWIARRSLD